MAKPIFIIDVPVEVPPKNLIKLSNQITELLTDYHVLVVTSSTEEIKFSCFYEKDMTEIKFEELKQLVRDKLKE